MGFKKEVSYIFEFKNECYKEHHYIDNVVGLRFRISDGEPFKYLASTNVYGTGDEYKVLHTNLLGSEEFDSDENSTEYIVFFELPDINKIAILYVTIYNDGRDPLWLYKMIAINYHERLELLENAAG